MKGRHAAQKRAGSHSWLHLAIACFTGLSVFLLLFCVLALILCKTDIAPSYLPFMTVAVACVAVLAAAMVFSRMQGSHGLLCGLLFGAAAFGLLWLLSLAQGNTVLLLVEISFT